VSQIKEQGEIFSNLKKKEDLLHNLGTLFLLKLEKRRKTTTPQQQQKTCIILYFLPMFLYPVFSSLLIISVNTLQLSLKFLI
jgi:hypothetical protein